MRGFPASPEAAGLDDLPDAEDIAWRLIDYRCDAADGRPLRWSPAAAEILLVDWLPRKVAHEPEWFAQVPGVLAAMVRFAARRSGLDERFVAETLEAVERYGAPLADAAGDPERWGPAKGLVMRMRAEGVDLGDEDAVREWVEEFNHGLPTIGTGAAGPPDPVPDDEEMDRRIAEREEVDADGVRLLQEALASHRGAAPPEPDLALAAERLRRGMAERTWPHPHIRRGAGFGPRLPKRDAEVVVRSAAAYILQRNDLGLDIEEESAIASLRHADWLGAVIGLVRAGAGADAEAGAIVRAIARCPEIGGEPMDEHDRDHLGFVFELLLPAWRAAGMIDEDPRLTRLGAWALPRALAHAWSGDFDA